MQTETKECKWKKTYYVYNDEILALIKIWIEAELRDKPKIQDTIVRKMSYMIHKKIACYKNTHMYEDLLQEGRMGIMLAMEKFDMDKSPNFFHYSDWHIRNKIRIYLKKQARRKCEIPVEETSRYVHEKIDPIDVFEKRESINILLTAIDSLPKIDQQIIKMRFGFNEEESGKTYQQIGDVFSLSKQRIEQITSRAVLRLRKNKQLKDFFEDMGQI